MNIWICGCASSLCTNIGKKAIKKRAALGFEILTKKPLAKLFKRPSLICAGINKACELKNNFIPSHIKYAAPVYLISVNIVWEAKIMAESPIATALTCVSAAVHRPTAPQKADNLPERLDFDKMNKRSGPGVIFISNTAERKANQYSIVTIVTFYLCLKQTFL